MWYGVMSSGESDPSDIMVITLPFFMQTLGQPPAREETGPASEGNLVNHQPKKNRLRGHYIRSTRSCCNIITFTLRDLFQSRQ